MTIQIASGPAAWGIYQIEDGQRPYGEVLDAIQAAGYDGTVLGPWGYYPTDPAVLGDELAARNLRLASATVPVNLSDRVARDTSMAHLLEVGRLLAALESELLVLTDAVTADSRPAREAGRVRSPRFSPDEARQFAGYIHEIAQRLWEESGLRMAFGHVVGTHIETVEEVRLLAEHLDPALVGLRLDTGQWHYAGGRPAVAIEHYGPRLWQLDLSDSEPTIRQFGIDEKLNFYEAMQAGVLCKLGVGDVDFRAIAKGLLAIPFSGWLVVAQDALLEDAEEQLNNARDNLEFVRSLGL